jgi:hypothetical protein
VCRAAVVETRYRLPSVGKRRQVQLSAVKVAPRCQLGPTNNLTKNSGIGWARSVSADFIKKASAHRCALAPLNKTAQEDWYCSVIGAFTGIFKRVQAASSEGKRRQVCPSVTKCNQVCHTVMHEYRHLPTSSDSLQQPSTTTSNHRQLQTINNHQQPSTTSNRQQPPTNIDNHQQPGAIQHRCASKRVKLAPSHIRCSSR